jgi:uncharacterized protein (TIGR02145 family)
MKKKLTKTGLIIALAFICTNIVSAQNYMITFSGSGQSNVVEAVEVKNTTQQTSVTLNGTDTLHLVDVVGINPIIHENAAMKVYPNPTRHTSRVEFYNSEDGNVTVEIIDITGKTLSTLSVNLYRGLHAFEIQGLGSGIYLLKAIAETTVQQQRLITYAQSFGNPQINYLESFDLTQATAQIKSAKNIVEMQYNDGEILVLKGSSGDYSHTMSLIPDESQNIDFEFIECVDGDGNHYGVVTIGEQVWMAENLNFGTRINGSSNQTNSGIIEKYCYNDIESNCNTYGGLYQWDEMMQYSTIEGVQGICPPGWHIPTDAEWTALTDYLGGESVAGGKMRETGTTHWSPPNTEATNSSGFTGLPGGRRGSNGGFGNLGFIGNWWSSTEYSSVIAWHRFLDYDNPAEAHRGYSIKEFGFSVRCLRDN